MIKKSKLLIVITIVCIVFNVKYINSVAGVLLMIMNLMILFSLIINYNKIIDIFSPISIIYISLIISFSMKGMYILDTGKFKESMLVIPLIYVIIFLFFFTMGLYVRVSKNIKYKFVNLIDRELRYSKIELISLVICFIAIALYVGKMGTFNIARLTSDVLNNRKVFQNSGGLYFQTIILLFIQSALYINLIVFYKDKDKTKKRTLIISLILAINLFITFTLGGRGMILTPILMIFFLRFKIIGNIDFKKVFLVLILFIFFSGWYGMFRDGMIPSGSNVKASYMIENVIDRYVQFDNLIRLSNNPVEYTFGKSFVDFLLSPIPRSILPNKPYNFNSQMTQIYHPTQAENMIVTDFTAIAELFMNFGIIGIIIGGMIFGMLIGCINRVYSKENIFLLFWYPFIMIKPMSVLYGGMINSTVNMMILLETPIIIIIWLIYTRKYNYKSKYLIK